MNLLFSSKRQICSDSFRSVRSTQSVNSNNFSQKLPNKLITVNPQQKTEESVPNFRQRRTLPHLLILRRIFLRQVLFLLSTLHILTPDIVVLLLLQHQPQRFLQLVVIPSVIVELVLELHYLVDRFIELDR